MRREELSYANEGAFTHRTALTMGWKQKKDNLEVICHHEKGFGWKKEERVSWYLSKQKGESARRGKIGAKVRTDRAGSASIHSKGDGP